MDFKPKTPEEFINYYFEALRDLLGVYSVQVNKVGFIGFLMNVLGHTNYDLKNYYDYLFKEAFVSTSEKDSNIHLHASIYGYHPGFATASEVFGEIELDFNLLPFIQSNVTRREVVLNSINSNLKFSVDNFRFQTPAVYKMIYENGIYNTIIIREDGHLQQYPASSSVVTVPIFDAKQCYDDEIIFIAENYPANSFYQYSFEIDDGFLSDITVFVTKKNQLIEEEYQVKFVKFLEKGNEKVVFLRKLTATSYMLELGSGMCGEWLPQATIRIKMSRTYGAGGNFLREVLTSQTDPSQIQVFDYDENNNLLYSTNLTANKLVNITITSSENGKDSLFGVDLRDDVIRYIQTRENLITELDFYNIAKGYLTDFQFLFKKTNVFDNIFYMYRVFRDKFQNVLPSTNHTIEKSLFTNFYKPVFILNNTEFISPFLYKLNTLTNLIEGYIIFEDLFVYIGKIQNINMTATNIPPLYFNLKYNNTLNETKIQLKSYQDISSLTFKITINDLQIYNQLMNFIDENTFEIIYSNLIFDEFSISIKCSENTTELFEFITPSIKQIYDVTDLIGIVCYKYNSIDYIVNIPIVSKEVFDSNEEYYLTKINNYLADGRFSQNRMISDNVQFRFLNSFLIESPYLENSVLQNNKIINCAENWLEDVVSYINEPPSTPMNEERFLIGTSPSGIFVSHENDIATWNEVAERTEIICNDASTLVGGEYFFLYTPTNSFYVWYNIDGLSTQPVEIGIGIEINILSSDTADEIAIKTVDVLNLQTEFEVHHPNISTINIVNSVTGSVADALDNNTGFTITVLKQGVDGHYTFYSPNINDGVLVKSSQISYYFNSSNEWTKLSLTLPLKLFIELDVNKEYITFNNINLERELRNIKFLVANYLQQTKTGTSMIYYDSQIIDYVHTDKPYIKSIKVTTKDSNGRIIENGIEVLLEKTILTNLMKNKFNTVTYTPIFWFWDVDNIDIQTNIN